MFDEKEKAKRIKKERRRLKDIYGELAEEKTSPVAGLIQQAANLRVTLEDIAADLAENGYTELFQQGKDQTPYDRRRPNADLYNSYLPTYLKIMKQLYDMMPAKDDSAKEEVDPFDDFVASRDKPA